MEPWEKPHSGNLPPDQRHNRVTVAQLEMSKARGCYLKAFIPAARARTHTHCTRPHHAGARLRHATQGQDP